MVNGCTDRNKILMNIGKHKQSSSYKENVVLVWILVCICRKCTVIRQKIWEPYQLFALAPSSTRIWRWSPQHWTDQVFVLVTLALSYYCLGNTATPHHTSAHHTSAFGSVQRLQHFLWWKSFIIFKAWLFTSLRSSLVSNQTTFHNNACSSINTDFVHATYRNIDQWERLLRDIRNFCDDGTKMVSPGVDRLLNIDYLSSRCILGIHASKCTARSPNNVLVTNSNHACSGVLYVSKS